MIYRKILDRLERFASEGGQSALLVDGARQVGKTFIIEEFGRTRYESVIKIDFVKMKGAIRLFQDVEDEADIIERISAFTRKPMVPRKKRQTLQAAPCVEPCFIRTRVQYP